MCKASTVLTIIKKGYLHVLFSEEKSSKEISKKSKWNYYRVRRAISEWGGGDSTDDFYELFNDTCEKIDYIEEVVTKYENYFTENYPKYADRLQSVMFVATSCANVWQDSLLE